MKTLRFAFFLISIAVCHILTAQDERIGKLRPITFNPDRETFSIGNINTNTFSDKGWMIGPTPYGTMLVSSVPQHLFIGQTCAISPGMGGHIAGGTKFGRLIVDTITATLLNVTQDTIEFGFANVTDPNDHSVYTNLFTAKKRKNDFTDVQRICARYFDSLPFRNRSYMEMIHFIGLSKNTINNGIFINNEKVQINWHQTLAGYNSGDTTNGIHWEYSGKGFTQYGSMGKMNARIDTTGHLTINSQQLLGPLTFYNTDSASIYAINRPSTGDTYFCTDCTARDQSTGVKVCYNGKMWKREW